MLILEFSSSDPKPTSSPYKMGELLKHRSRTCYFMRMSHA
nr:MAG TPA: hypothetical protein [Caudoviricetes sp.]